MPARWIFLVAACAACAAAAPAPTRLKGEIRVGEVFRAKLPCSPTTGYAWELKSVDRKIAVPAGPTKFVRSPATPGAVGAGGECFLELKGVAPGKTEAVLAYRRRWEKKPPIETASVELTVLPAHSVQP